MASLFQSQSQSQGGAELGEDSVALARDLASSVLPGHWDELRGQVSSGETGTPLSPLWEQFFRLLGPGGFDTLGARQHRLLSEDAIRCAASHHCPNVNGAEASHAKRSGQRFAVFSK